MHRLGCWYSSRGCRGPADLLTPAPPTSPPAVTWEQPWAAVGAWEVVSVVNNGGRPEIPAPRDLRGGAFPGLPAYTALLRRCWAQNPYDRPSFAELVPELRALLEATGGGADAH